MGRRTCCRASAGSMRALNSTLFPQRPKRWCWDWPLSDVKPYLANAEKKTRATFDVVDEAEGAVIYAQGVNAHASTPYEGVNALTALNTLLAALPLHGHGAELVRGLSRIFPHGDFYGVGAGVAQEDAVSGKLTITLDMLDGRTQRPRGGGLPRRALRQRPEPDRRHAREIRLHRLYDGRQQDVSAALCFRGFSSGAHAAEGLRGLHRQARPLHRHRRRHLCPQPEGGVSFGAAFEGTNNNMHGPDEFALKEHLLVTIKMYAQVICDLCK